MDNINSIQSHPGRPLVCHLRSVSDISYSKMNEFKNDPIYKDFYPQLSRIIAVSHDIWKINPYFQSYIAGNSPKSLKGNHAKVSSIIAYYLARVYLKRENIPDIDFYASIAYIVVSEHHSYMKNVVENNTKNNENSLFYYDLRTYTGYNVNELLKEIEKNNNNLIDILDRSLDLLDRNSISIAVNESINTIKSMEDNSIVDSLSDLKPDISRYFIIKLFYSVLVNSDIYDAIGKDNFIKYEDELAQSRNFIINNGEAKISEYIKHIPDSFLSSARNKIFKYMTENKIYNSENISIIKLGTGYGKTLISLNLAFKLLKYKSRIFYVVPFLSISDQVYNICGKLLGYDKIERFDHVSGIDSTKRNPEEEPNVYDFINSTWQNNLIITTFVSFFNTIFGNKKAENIKFMNLENSVVIIDEIQNIPAGYYDIISKAIEFLANNMNIKFYIMSATVPPLFPEDRIIQLPESLRINQNRYEIEYMNKQIESEDVLNYIPENFKSIIIVANTIKSSRTIYDRIVAKFSNTAIFYLSSMILHNDRIKIINNFKECKGRKILVSTQVIEAGVDISAEFVIRDLCPFDSIVQSAGRCNRDGESSSGKVTVVNIYRDGKSDACRVYSMHGKNRDEINMEITRQIIDHSTQILESNIEVYVNEFFKMVSEKKSTSKLYYEFKNLNYYNLAKDFSLIDQERTFEVLLLSCDNKLMYLELKNTINKIRNGVSDKYDLLMKSKNLRKKLANYIINIHSNEDFEEMYKDNYVPELNLYVIEKDGHYGPTGFIY